MPALTTLVTATQPSSKVQACTPKEIMRANETKPYRLLAVPVMNHLCCDKTLSDKAFRVWFYLWQIAGSKEDYRVTMSNQWLGKKLGKSALTIRRALTELEELGYLIRKENFDDRGSQNANDLLVRVPQEMIQKVIREYPNRRDLKAEKTDQAEQKQQDSLFSGLFVTMDDIIPSETVEATLSESANPPASPFKPNKEQLRKALNNHQTPEQIKNTYQRMRQSYTQPTAANTAQKHPQPRIKTERGEGIKSDYPKKTIYRVLNEQNKNPLLVSQKRTLFPHTLRRLTTRLSELGFKGHQLEQIATEICFAVEQPEPESLFAKLEVQHCLNIALKKAKQGQWSTPGHMRRV